MFENFKRAAACGGILITFFGIIQAFRGADLMERLGNYSASEFIVAQAFAVSALICVWCRIDRRICETYKDAQAYEEAGWLAHIQHPLVSIPAYLIVFACGLMATADGCGSAIPIAIVSVLHGFRSRRSPIPLARLVP